MFAAKLFEALLFIWCLILGLFLVTRIIVPFMIGIFKETKEKGDEYEKKVVKIKRRK